ncbi:MAG: NAD-dependent epimerase/dehydratase family protein [Rickettsiales bacterium]|nr:NAD-dependent epimerase/dehydratase family protein [Rickettsiales bacterium]
MGGKHYLVTGGAGFIGSHLCDALLLDGHEVSVIDDLSTGHRANVSPDANFILGDCADPNIVKPIINAVDGVFHLAAIASVQKSREEWLDTSKINLLSSIALLDAISKRDKPIPFVCASSAAIYGNPDFSHLPIKESTPSKPLTPYGADKRSMELYAAVARSMFNIPTLSLRFFNVFGPRQDPHSPYSGVISVFAQRISNDQTIKIFGDGTQTRDFIYVSDVAQQLMRAIRRLEEGVTGDVQAVNICTGKAISINKLAETIGMIAGKENYKKQHVDPRPGDIHQSVGDVTLAKEGFGMKVMTSFDEGLKQTLQWLKEA